MLSISGKNALRLRDRATMSIAGYFPYLICFLAWILFQTEGTLNASSIIVYQGSLSTGGVGTSGSFDFVFSLYDCASNGSAVSTRLTNSEVAVKEGAFEVVLDFGQAPFDGRALWLEIGVRSAGGSESFTTLSPRQAMTIAPYSGATPTPQPSLDVPASPVPVPLVYQAPSAVTSVTSIGNAVQFTSAGTNSLAGYTLQNGTWGDPYGLPVAFFQPTTWGESMPLDLMPKGPASADTWIDICDRDVTLFNASFWEALDLRKHADDYAQIGTSTLGGQIRDLILQHNGGRLGVGRFDSVTRPLLAFQVRPQPGVNLGVDANAQGLLMAAYPDSGNGRIPIRTEAARVMFSSDYAGYSAVFAQFRPVTNVNLGIDNLGGSARVAAFVDNASVQIPIVYQASEHHFLNSFGRGEMLTLTSNNVGVNQTTPDPRLSLDVGGATRAARPFPPVTLQQRQALGSVPEGASVYNTDLGAIEYSRGGKWYRQGQRPSVVAAVGIQTYVSDDTDILLVKGTGSRVVYLPPPKSFSNRVLEIKDAAFRASTDAISISSPTGLVDNQPVLKITSNGAAVRLVSDGTDWFKLN